MGILSKEEKESVKAILTQLNTPIDLGKSDDGTIVTYPHYKTIDNWEQEDDYALYLAVNSEDQELIQFAQETLYNCMSKQIREKGQIIFVPVNLLVKHSDYRNDRFLEFLRVNGNRSEEDFFQDLYVITINKLNKYDPTKGKNRSHSSVYNFINNTCLDVLYRNMYVKENQFGQKERGNKNDTEIRDAEAFLKAKGIDAPKAGDIREAVILLAQAGRVRYRYDYTLSRVVTTLEDRKKARNGDYITTGDEDEYSNMKDESSRLSPTKTEIEQLDMEKYTEWSEGEERVTELKEFEDRLGQEIDKASFAVLHPMHKKILYSWIIAKYQCIKEEEERQRRKEEKKYKKRNRYDDDEDEEERKAVKREPDMKMIREIYETKYGGRRMSTDDIKRLLNCAQLEFKKERYGLLNAYKSDKKKYMVGIKYADNSEENDAFTKEDFETMVMEGLW